GERVAERPWLKQLDDVSIGHGVSLLCWRSGGSNTPTIRRLLPVRPSPTSAHSSPEQPEAPSVEASPAINLKCYGHAVEGFLRFGRNGSRKLQVVWCS